MGGGGGIGGSLGSLLNEDGRVLDLSAFKDIGGANNAASNANTAASQQASQSASLQQQLLQQPQNVSPDNFLATKNRMLTNMRLGLASTITSGAGTPSPVLSAPALTGAPGKKTLGS